MKRLWIVATLLVLLCEPAHARILHAKDFGAVGNGKQDDGPAIQRACNALSSAEPGSELVFEPSHTYRVTTAADTWLLRLDKRKDLTINGGNSLFLLAPATRFLHLTNCVRIQIRKLKVDFDPLPFAEGVVTNFSAQQGWIEAQLSPEFPPIDPGGPTGDREQAYFGMVYPDNGTAPVSAHLFIRDVQNAGDGGATASRQVRVYASQPFTAYSSLKKGASRICLPVRGIAHKMNGHGASPVFVVEDDTDISFDHIELWSGPLFGVNVARCAGNCLFQSFNIRPRPGTTRFTSTWRDGFHVKGCRAKLTWNNCILDGMNDDAFNIATHSSRVNSVSRIGKVTTLQVHQNFPLGYVPICTGDKLGIFSATAGKLLPIVTATAVKSLAPLPDDGPDKPAPSLQITLNADVAVSSGDTLWNASAGNPNTVLKHCTINNSCRFQSGVTLFDCTVHALIWLYGDATEGPLPQNSVISGCKLSCGRGNATIAVAITSLMPGPDGSPRVPTEPVISGFRMQDCEVTGDVDIRYCREPQISRTKVSAGTLRFVGCSQTKPPSHN